MRTRLRIVWACPATAAALMAAALLISGTGAAAEQVGSSFGADDPAEIGCELFAKMYERAPTGTERQFYNWAQGYFAGRSAAAAGRALPASGVARKDMFQKLLGICAKDPSASFGAAVLALWNAGG